MPGHHISDQQVFLFMTHRRQHTQAVAAAKAGISERSARRIENDPQLPSQKKKERHWRTRADPLEPFWPRVEELLQIDGIIAVTVFETLQDEFGEITTGICLNPASLICSNVEGFCVRSMAT